MNREEAKQEIRKNLDCRDYLEKSKGANMYVCPFCGSGHNGNRNDGALKYYAETNTWTCHKCKKSGDVLDLIQKKYAVGYSDALQIGADQLGISIDAPQEKPQEAPSGPEWSQTMENTSEQRNAQETPRNVPQRHIMPDAPAGSADYSAYYTECAARLENSPEAVAYLKKRGISLTTARNLFIGYDPAADPGTAPGALQKDEYQKPYPAKRIIIPTSPAHFVARAIDSAKSEYPKMNPSTRKGAGSPGIFNADAIYQASEAVFIVEGWADAASIEECGGHAAALNSTSNGGALLRLLNGKPAECSFIVSFDNDKAPQTAAQTNKEAENLVHDLTEAGYKAIRYNLAGTHKDCNESLTADGADRMKAAIRAAIKAAKRDYLADFLDKIQSEAYKPCATDLQWFDSLLGGGIIQQSLLLLLAAPGVGKTTLCQQIAESMAIHHKRVIYLNYEMSREQMIAKAISARLNRKGIQKNLAEILQGYDWSAADRQAITAEIEAYRREAFPFIQYNPGGSSNDIQRLQELLTATGERAKGTGQDAPAVVVDYLQLLAGKPGTDAQETIKAALLSLKDYARKYNTFVIAIVATNRDSNKAGRITLSSGRDSSNIEYTADYQLSLNYEAIDSGEIKADDVEGISKLQAEPLRRMIIRVLKNRFSLPGKKALVFFDAAHNTFYAQGRTEAENGAIIARAKERTEINY